MQSVTVPLEDAPWQDIWRFALTYNAYDRLGGFDTASEHGNRARDRWNSEQVLPDELDGARAALFFEQRRFRHFDSDPSGEDEVYVRALIALIRQLSGGSLPGPPDSLP